MLVTGTGRHAPTSQAAALRFCDRRVVDGALTHRADDWGDFIACWGTGSLQRALQGPARRGKDLPRSLLDACIRSKHRFRSYL